MIPAKRAHMDKPHSLYELNTRIKNLLKGAFEEPTWVVAEIHELNINRSGHCYLELVEKDGVTDHIVARSRATIWARTFHVLRPYFETTTGRPFSAGIKVLLHVNVEFHELYGLSLNIRDIDPGYTLGDMARQRQETLERLRKEGIFNMNKDLDFPLVPSRIALISSETAAGYEDFLDQLHGNPYGYHFNVVFFPAVMQGQQAASSIISVLDQIYLNESSFDLVVLVRGGGSQADLSVFNDHSLASHIAQFPLPVVTGIGHEKDESVADLVAFKSLKTPTAVAEFLLDKFIELDHHITELSNKILGSVGDYLYTHKKQLENIHLKFRSETQRMIYLSALNLNRLQAGFKPALKGHITHQERRLDRHSNAFRYAIREYTAQLQIHLLNFKKTFRHQVGLLLHDQKQTLNMHEKTIQLMDPRAILKRGYSITYQEGRVIYNAEQLDVKKDLKTIYSRGSSTSTLTKISTRKT